MMDYFLSNGRVLLFHYFFPLVIVIALLTVLRIILSKLIKKTSSQRKKCILLCVAHYYYFFYLVAICQLFYFWQLNFQTFPFNILIWEKLVVLLLSIWGALFSWRVLKKIDENPSIAVGDVTTTLAITKLFRIAIVVFFTLNTAQILNLPLSGLIAFGGVGGLAVGFAAKDLLANFFGGFMIFLDRPFNVGDWIRSPDKTIEGTVEYIGWRLTRIRTFDKRALYIPNGIFSTIAIENPSRMTNRRIKTQVGVRYCDHVKVAAMTDAIEAMLKGHDGIDQQQTLFVQLVEFAPSALTLQIYTFTKTTDWVTYQRVQQDVYLQILQIIEQFGASCAFPTRTVEMTTKKDTP